MQFEGILIGLATFLIIGLFHPIVIKGEYYFTKKIWFLFLVLGILFTAGSLFISNLVVSILMGVTGFTCFWTILELFEQEKRVQKGWFPENPKRKKKMPQPTQSRHIK